MWKGPGQDPGGSGSVGPPQNPSSSHELNDLKDQYEQQQLLIAQLKEMLRKSEQTNVTEEKVEEYASTLSKMSARAKRNIRKKEESGETVGVPGSKRIETPASEKINMLRQQLEQNKVKLAERGKSQKGIEEMVTQLKAQFDDSQNLISQSPLNLSLVDAKTETYSVNSNSQELHGILLNREKRITDMTAKIQKLEANVLDLQENLKEKDSVIDARTKAITLMSENLSKKGKSTLDALDDTKLQMRKMQENFVELELQMKAEKQKLVEELEMKNGQVNSLQQANDFLHKTRQDLFETNTELQEKLHAQNEVFEKYKVELGSASNAVINLEESLSLHSEISRLNNQIKELEELRNSEMSQTTRAASKTDETDSESKINNLAKEVEDRSSENAELKNRIIELEKDVAAKGKQIDDHVYKVTELENVIQDLSTRISKESEPTTKNVDLDIQVENEGVVKLKRQLEESNKNMIKVKAQHKSKIKELNKKIDAFKKMGDANVEIVKLQDDNSKLNQKIAELEEEKGAVQLKMMESDSSKDSIDAERVNELEQKISEQTELISTKEKQIEDYVSHIETLNEKLVSLSHLENAQVKSEITSIHFEEQLDKLEAEKQLLIKEKEESLSENALLLKKIEAVTKDKQEVAAKLDSYIQENIDLMDRLEKLSAEKVSSAESIEIVEGLTQQEKLELAAYQKNVNISTGIKSSTEHLEENPELNESVNQLTEETTELLQRIELFTVERREVMDKMEHLTQENNHLSLKIKEIENNRDVLAETYEQLQNEKEQLDTSFGNLEKEKAELETRLNELETENSKLKQDINDKEEATEKEVAEENFKSEIISDLHSSTQLANENLLKEIEEFKALIDIQRQEINELRVHLMHVDVVREEKTDLEEKIMSLQSQYETLLAENEKFKQQIKRDSERVHEKDHIDEELTNAKTRITEFEEKITNNLSEIANYKSTLEENKTELIASTNVINDLQIGIQRKEAELMKYRNEVEHLNSNISELNNAIKHLEQENNEKTQRNESVEIMSVQLQELKHMLNENIQQIQEYEHELEANSETIRQLQKEIKTLSNKIIETEHLLESKDDEIVKLRKEREEKEVEITDLQGHINRLKEDFDKARDDFKVKYVKLKNQIDSNTGSIEDIRIPLETKIQELENKNKEQLEKMKKIAAGLKKKTAAYQELEQKYSEVNEKWEIEHKEKETLKMQANKNSALESKVQSLIEQLNDLESEVTNVQNKLDAKETELADARNKHDAKESESKKLLEEFSLSKQEEFAKLENKNLELQQLISHNTLQLEDLQNVLREYEAKFHSLSTANELLWSSANNHLSEEIDRKDEIIANLSTELENLRYHSEAKSNALQMKIKELDMYIETQDLELSKYKERVDKLEEGLSQVEERRMSLERRAIELGAELQEKSSNFEEVSQTEDLLEQRLSALMAHDEEIEKRLQDAVSENRDLTEQNKSLSNEINSLKTKVEAAHEKINQLNASGESLTLLESENVHLKQSVSNLETEKKHMRNEYERRLTTSKIEAEKNEVELQSQLELFDNERKTLLEQCEKLNDQLKEYVEAQELLNNEVLEYKRKLEEQQDTISTQGRKLNKLSGENKKYRSTIEDLSAQLRTVEGINKEVDILNKLLEDKNSEIEGYQKENQQLQMQHLQPQVRQNPFSSNFDVPIVSNQLQGAAGATEDFFNFGPDSNIIVEDLKKQIRNLETQKHENDVKLTETHQQVQDTLQELQGLKQEKEEYQRQNLQLQMQGAFTQHQNPIPVISNQFRQPFSTTGNDFFNFGPDPNSLVEDLNKQIRNLETQKFENDLKLTETNQKLQQTLQELQMLKEETQECQRQIQNPFGASFDALAVSSQLHVSAKGADFFALEPDPNDLLEDLKNQIRNLEMQKIENDLKLTETHQSLQQTLQELQVLKHEKTKGTSFVQGDELATRELSDLREKVNHFESNNVKLLNENVVLQEDVSKLKQEIEILRSSEQRTEETVSNVLLEAEPRAESVAAFRWPHSSSDPFEFLSQSSDPVVVTADTSQPDALSESVKNNSELKENSQEELLQKIRTLQFMLYSVEKERDDALLQCNELSGELTRLVYDRELDVEYQNLHELQYSKDPLNLESQVLSEADTKMTAEDCKQLHDAEFEKAKPVKNEVDYTTPVAEDKMETKTAYLCYKEPQAVPELELPPQTPLDVNLNFDSQIISQSDTAMTSADRKQLHDIEFEACKPIKKPDEIDLTKPAKEDTMHARTAYLCYKESQTEPDLEPPPYKLNAPPQDMNLNLDSQITSQGDTAMTAADRKQLHDIEFEACKPIKKPDKVDFTKPAKEDTMHAETAYLCYNPDTNSGNSLGIDTFGENDDGWVWGPEEAKLEEEHREKVDSASHSPQFKAQINELEGKIRVLEEARERHVEEIKLSQLKSGKLIKKLKEFKSKNEELSSRLNKKSDGFDDLNDAIQDELKSQIQNLERKIKEISTELERERQEKNNLLKRVDVLTAANERLIENKEKQDVEILAWQQRSRELSAKLEQFEWGDGGFESPKHVKQGKSKQEEAEGDVRDLQKQIQELNETLKDLTLDNEELQALLEEQRNLRIGAEKAKSVEPIPENMKTEAEYLALLSEKNELSSDLTLARQETLKLQNEVGYYARNVDAISQQLAEVNRENSQLNDVVLQNNQVIQDLNEKLQNSQRECDSLAQSQKSGLQTDLIIDELRQNVDVLNSELGKSQEENKKLRNDLAKLNLENHDLLGQVSEKKNELNYFEHTVFNLNAKLSSLLQASDSGNNLSDEIDKLKQSLEEKSKELNELRQNLQHKSEDLQAVAENTHQQQSIIEESGDLKHQLEEKSRQLQAIEDTTRQQLSSIEEKSKEIDGLKQKLDEKSEQLQALEEKALQQQSDFEYKLSTTVEYLTEEWTQRVDQRGRDVAESWKLHVETRENEFMQIEQQLRKDINELEEKCNGLVNENNELRRNVDAEIRNEIDRVSALQQQINDRQTYLSELTRMMQEKQLEVEEQQEKIAQFEGKVYELRTQVEERDARIASLGLIQLEITEKERGIEELSKMLEVQGIDNKKLTELEEEIGKNKTVIIDLQSQVAIKEELIKQSSETADAYSQELERYKQSDALLNQEVKEKEEQIENLLKELRDRDTQKEVESSNVSSLQQQIYDYQQQLATANGQLQQSYAQIETLNQDFLKYSELNDLLPLKESEINRLKSLLQERETEMAYMLENKSQETLATLNEQAQEVESLKRFFTQNETHYEEQLSVKEVDNQSLRLQLQEEINKNEFLLREKEEFVRIQTELSLKCAECDDLEHELHDQNILLDEENRQLVELREIIQDQVLKIEDLQKHLYDKSKDYDALIAEIDVPQKSRKDLQEKHVTFADESETKVIPSPPPDDDLAEPVSRAELDLALYMLHQRDVRCEELTVELMQLLEERDTLQLRLSNAIRENEGLRSKPELKRDDTGEGASSRKDSPKTGAVPKGKVSAIVLGATGTELATEAAEQLKQENADHLRNKLTELKTVGYRKDKTLVDEQELRRYQQFSIMQQHRDEAAKLPPEAAARLVDASYTLSRDVQSPSKVLLNWLWGRSTPRVNNV